MMSSAGKNLNSLMAREAGNKEKVVEKVYLSCRDSIDLCFRS